MTLEDKINAHFTRLIGGVVYQTDRLFLTVVKPNTILSIFLGFGIAICIKIRGGSRISSMGGGGLTGKHTRCLRNILGMYAETLQCKEKVIKEGGGLVPPEPPY